MKQTQTKDWEKQSFIDGITPDNIIHQNIEHV